MSDSWSHEEVEATVADYFEMLELEVRGREYNKTEHRRHLAALLNHRTNGAIERKHQNISAILIQLGFVYITCYKPLRNYQQLLFDVVSNRLERGDALATFVRQQVAAPAAVPSVDDILTALVEPPVPEPSRGNYRTSSVPRTATATSAKCRLSGAGGGQPFSRRCWRGVRQAVRDRPAPCRGAHPARGESRTGCRHIRRRTGVRRAVVRDFRARAFHRSQDHEIWPNDAVLCHSKRDLRCRESRALNFSFIALSTSTGSRSYSARPVQ
jgi:hypothetical protein